MVTINRANAISYLADLYKTAGDGNKILPDIFTAAVCDICSDGFVPIFDTWVFRTDKKTVPQSEVKIHAESFELEPNVKHSFEDICAFVKWDLIHQKLKELNHA